MRDCDRRPHDAHPIADPAPRRPESGRTAGLSHVQVTVPRKGGRPGRKDPAKPVPGLLRHPAGGGIVHLVEQVEAFQAFGRESLESPAGESLQSPGGHPATAGVRHRPVADLCGLPAGTRPLDDDAAHQPPLAGTGALLAHGEAQPLPGDPAAPLDLQPPPYVLRGLQGPLAPRRNAGSRNASTSGSMSPSPQGRSRSAEADGVASTRKVMFIKVLPGRLIRSSLIP